MKGDPLAEATAKADFPHPTGDASCYRFDSTAPAAKAASTRSRQEHQETLSSKGVGGAPPSCPTPNPGWSLGVRQTFRVTRMSPEHQTSPHLSSACSQPTPSPKPTGQRGRV